jgi:hypothetical protein
MLRVESLFARGRMMEVSGKNKPHTVSGSIGFKP